MKISNSGSDSSSENAKATIKKEKNKSTAQNGDSGAVQLSRVADMPMGLSFSLARNVKAMTAFCAMSDEERKSVIEGARAIGSKQQMKEYVNNIAKGSF